MSSALPTSAAIDWDNKLVAYYGFENIASGQVTDESSWANTGQVVGSPSSVSGKFGKALQFDGIDDYLNIPDIGAGSLDARQVTIEAWMYQTERAEYQIIVNKENVRQTPWVGQLRISRRVPTGMRRIRNFHQGHSTVE